MKWIFILLIYFLLAVGCGEDEKLKYELPEGTYQYNAFDSIDVKIVIGCFSFGYDDNTNLSGKWNFENIGNPENIGPQVGIGELHGRIEEDSIWIDLTPEHYAIPPEGIEYVFLYGEVIEKEITGEWTYFSPMGGFINRGSFTVLKQDCEVSQNSVENRVWVFIDPIQCLSNPWEVAWLEEHDHNYDSYPISESERLAIFEDYYEGHSIEIYNMNHEWLPYDVCAACGCPNGDRIHCEIDVSDVEQMIKWGFTEE